ncbi:hypothetical protein [Aquincola sp. J276]|uniref:hypothetical protein n=1 Tax=Aquincola sp. J276 TaxID=2898432 RepID=UPI002151D28D|nr:hypothetical protein [Aquincola sp. J276]MCR5864656.1 hypothetical protein [Aquincola sp. J276]
MSIQMLATWGGYEQWGKYTLAPAEEARLIAAGLARSATADSPSPVMARLDPVSGAVVGASQDLHFAAESYGQPAKAASFAALTSSQTSLRLFTAAQAMPFLQAQFDSLGVAQTYVAYLEYPLGATPLQLTVAGQAEFTVQVNAGAVLTDPVPTSIQAGETFGIRTYGKVVNLNVDTLRGLDTMLLAGESTSALGTGAGYGPNAAAAAGAIAGGATGPSSVRCVGPSAIISSRGEQRAVLGIHDSIGAGVGIPDDIPTPSITLRMNNWFTGGLRDAGHKAFAQHSIGGEQLSTLFDAGAALPQWRSRLTKLRFSDDVFCNLAYNDFPTKTWQEIALYMIKMAKLAAAAGARFHAVTSIPSVQVVGNIWRASTQVPTWVEKRTAWNTWLRNGCQLDSSGVPVLSGGTPSPYVFGVFDLAAELEVDENNVLTRNGGRFICNPTPRYGGLVITAVSGAVNTVPVLTIGAGGLPAYTGGAFGLHPLVGVIRTGVAAGQSAICTTANTATTVRLYGHNTGSPTGVLTPGLSTMPEVGDIVDIYESASNDGIHLTPWGNNMARPGFMRYLLRNQLGDWQRLYVA